MQTFVYNFRFGDGGTESFLVPAAADTETAELPAWTALDFHQCPNCPLSAATTSHCPMAVQLIDMVKVFGKRISHDSIEVQVESEERTVIKNTTIQRAVRSLMGSRSASSDCPRVDFLKPMLYFHLPFSSEEEMIYRVTSMYLLAQYFLKQQDKTPDWDLVNLKANYLELQQVNMAMAARLRAISEQDGMVNGLVLLDLLARTLPFSIDAALEELAPVFEAYSRQQAG
jgi:hypothetical protein